MGAGVPVHRIRMEQTVIRLLSSGREVRVGGCLGTTVKHRCQEDHLDGMCLKTTGNLWYWMSWYHDGWYWMSCVLRSTNSLCLYKPTIWLRDVLLNKSHFEWIIYGHTNILRSWKCFSLILLYQRIYRQDHNDIAYSNLDLTHIS